MTSDSPMSTLAVPPAHGLPTESTHVFVRGAVVVVTAALILSTAGCAANQRMIPEDNQKRAEHQYGEQKNSMGSLNETAAEQAAGAHQDSLPRDPDDEEE